MKIFFIVSLMAIFLLTTTSQNSLGAKSTEAKDDKPQPKPIVTVAKAATESLTDQLIYSAQVRSQMETVLPADQSGLIAALNVKLGETVTRGQKLFQIKSLDPVFEYRPRTQVAPVGGVIAELNLQEGTVINKGEKALTIVAPEKLEIEVLVPAKDRNALVSLVSADFVLGELRVPLKLRSVSPMIDAVTSTVKASLVPIDTALAKKLLIGQLGQVQLAVNPRQSIVVPLSSIAFVGEESFLKILEAGNTVKKVPVTIARSESDSVEISNQEVVGKTFIVRSNKRVVEGDVVEIEAPPAAEKSPEQSAEQSAEKNAENKTAAKTDTQAETKTK